MPITIKTAQHEAYLIDTTYKKTASHPKEILNRVHSQRHGNLLQSSFDDDDMPPSISADRNGFVHAVTEAYNHHHHLVIRPEDIWLAITTQFSAYVNAHAEDLRHAFVSHEGQKELKVVYETGSRYTVDWGNFAQQIVGLIEQNILDPDLREWILPSFTTTTWHDRITAQVVMMGTLQSYFKYVSMICCGIPSVTLEGEKEDYELILQRLGKLCEYGSETTDFSNILKPIVQGFVDTFDGPESDSVKAFWKQICDYRGGSGISRYSGWITAFCFWDTKGKRQIKRVGDYIDSENIPNGFTTVPVTIDDNGLVVLAEMLAGSVGIVGTSSGKPSVIRGQYRSLEEKKANEGKEGPIGNDTMQPQLGWFMYEKADQPS
ncbi:hypothetical protein IQ07DRAFT_585032 [Pyrenochaeta sp. DS3sAY3a]|nr:hypothetical protein IQ07DRAFT_585032 [Pyrenochaeta sp. DS3sAY3a]